MPRLTLAIGQAIVYFGYSALPIYGIDRFQVLYMIFPSKKPAAPDEKWTAFLIANYSVLYLLLMFLQFFTLRRFSKHLLFGLALRN